jgi:hypothetical protein
MSAKEKGKNALTASEPAMIDNQNVQHVFYYCFTSVLIRAPSRIEKLGQKISATALAGFGYFITSGTNDRMSKFL